MKAQNFYTYICNIRHIAPKHNVVKRAGDELWSAVPDSTQGVFLMRGALANPQHPWLAHGLITTTFPSV